MLFASKALSCSLGVGGKEVSSGKLLFFREQCLIYSTGGPEMKSGLELEALKGLPALC